MSTHVLLHLNLLNTPEDTRADFYELLKSSKWFKVHPAFTAWKCRYKDEVADVENVVIREIKQLAQEAGVPHLYGVGQCGNAPAFDFEYRAAARSSARR